MLNLMPFRISCLAALACFCLLPWSSVMAEAAFVRVGSDLVSRHFLGAPSVSLALSADGTTLAIGSVELESESSAAIYRFVSGEWQFDSRIADEEPGDQFGTAVALSADGRVLAVGAPANDDNGIDSGHVKVFERDSSGWTLLGTPIAGWAPGDRSGSAISLNADGSLVLIGAPLNDGKGTDAGNVRVYRFNETNWQLASPDIDGTLAEDESGSSVSFNDVGNVLAIGSPQHQGVGQTRVYADESGVWQQIGGAITGSTSGGRSGQSVSLSDNGNIVAIGEPAVSVDGAGSVRAFSRVNDQWQQLGADIKSLPVGDRFGWQVRLNDTGNLLAVSAPDSGLEVDLTRYFALVDNSWEPLGGVLFGLAGESLVGQDLALNGEGTIVSIAWRGINSSGDDITGVSVFALDTDADGVGDYEDAFPLDPAEVLDTDGDGIGNNFDDDDDNDGVVDTIDELPFDPDEVTDADGDGIGDITDIDDDNDGVPDDLDDLPFNSLESVDTDRDGLGNTEDMDDDNDGLLDSEDLLALDAVDPLSADLIWSYVTGLQNTPNYGEEDLVDASGRSIAMSDDGSVVVVGGARSEVSRTVRECVSGICDFSSQVFTSGAASIFVRDLVSPESYRRNWSLHVEAEVSISNLSSSQQNNLFDSINDERFGHDVAVSGDGNVAAIGAPGANKGRGRVYVYGLCDTASIKTRTFAFDEQFGSCDFERFDTSDIGYSVALNDTGNRLAVSDSQGVGVWHYDNGWLELGALSSEDYSPSFDLQSAVAMNAVGDVIAVSEPGYRTFSEIGNQTGQPGRVRVWQFDGAEWLLLGQQITGSDFSQFGTSISLDETGMRLAVSAPDAVLVQIYQFDGSSWLQEGEDIVIQADAMRGVALSGNGAALAIGSSFFGEVVAYDFHQGTWQARPVAATGASVALNRLGSVLVVGNPEQAEDNNNDLLFELGVDSDADGVIDRRDVFPIDDSETADLDGDGIGDNVDDDRDGDDFLNDEDAFPGNPSEWLDTDGDFIGNNADTDDDNDGILDIDDEEPLISAPPVPAGPDIAIGTILPPQVLVGGSTTTYIWARDIVAKFGLSHVTADVISPAGITFSVDLAVNLIPGRYETIYAGFVAQGDYQLSIVATDFSGNKSEPVLTTVTQQEVIPITGMDFFEPDDVIENAALIASDDLGPQRHNLFEAGDVDYVQFAARGGGTEDYYDISITYVGDGSMAGAPDLLLEVLDNNGLTVLDSVNPGIQSGFIGFEPTEDGIYYLRISNLADTAGDNTAYEVSVSQQLAGFAGPDVIVQQDFYTRQLTTGAGMLLEIQVLNRGGQGSRQTAPVVRLQSHLGGVELTVDVPGCELQPINILNCELGDLERGESRFFEVPIRVNRPGDLTLVSLAVGFDIDGRKMPDDNFSNNVHVLDLRVVDSADSDNDGLPDVFETQTGLDPNNSADGALDLDGDGKTNLAEYLEGTDPAVDQSNIPPFITLIGSSVVELALGDVFVDAGAIASDAEDGDLTFTVNGLVDTTVADTYLLVYVAVDQQGVSVSVERSVIVLPGLNTVPTITLAGPLEITIIEGGTFNDPGVIVNDDEDDILVPVVTGLLNTDLPAIYVLTYTVTDSGGLSASVDRMVTVLENRPPIVTLTGQTSIALTVDDTYVDQGATGADPEDGNLMVVVTGSVDTATAGTYKLTYTVTDSGGLTAFAERTVVVIPRVNQAPTITLTGATVTLTAGDTYSEPGVSGNDAEDGVLQVAVTDIDTSTPGTQTITYSVVDSGGLAATATRIVVVEEALPPPGTGIPLRLTPDKTIELPIVGQGLNSPTGLAQTVPAGATAVALNVTVVNPDGGGFVTVWPCGVDRPNASNLNYVAGKIVPNGVIAPIGGNGEVCFYSSSTTDLIVDIAGWFAGEVFVGATPQRLVDSRDGTGTLQGKLTSDAPVAISLVNLAVQTSAGASTVIPGNLTAAALNITVVNPVADGFVTVYPCDTARPLASNVNYKAGQVIANGVIAPVSAAGEVCVFSLNPTDIVVDLAGWFAGSNFTGALPRRLVDTRDGTGGHAGQLTNVTELAIPVRGNTLTVNGASRTIPSTASAVALNVTAVAPAAGGFITVYPCGVTRPEASNLNFNAGDVVANNVIAPIGDNGSVCLYTLSPTDVVVDIAGWFEGDAANGFVGATPKRQVDTRFGTGPAPK
ncbi:MAG: hypothetical protein ACJAVI_004792 [Candidatus Azotimanducaceae bacterium]|jgi:hypothetical protein